MPTLVEVLVTVELSEDCRVTGRWICESECQGSRHRPRHIGPVGVVVIDPRQDARRGVATEVCRECGDIEIVPHNVALD
ncbi:MAG: hypothetical protein KDB24_08830, partial [Microthrixaceae bacterium]|nr:hypothetical protein [Microthrixaceae bacterium]